VEQRTCDVVGIDLIARQKQPVRSLEPVRARLGVGGDFFEEVPGGGDAYLLSNVLHDWQDADATRILRNVWRVMPRRCRLLVVNEQMT
jgi:hypothetical protein